ncbi:SDR family oxidoreductase [Deinococcus yavapaiensis]|uniref:Uncharacterized protein YbjT (DUF2867 family) n=1 Tax=Deinococcus yavapaiensis KR-236 TaxID=694435 RepID=A0A318SLB8_9DEIO|nr:SDR family oxidoreductase [Deinococcus yavapaiensis]PYE55309.1 uncharacterized protein YbjT (DUF2867 family) [Deinococcus yavapaiensis KR-236]
MILVVGATGFLGSTICGMLARQGRSVRAVVRSSSDPVKVQALRDLGCDLVEADLKEPASLKLACAGVDTVVSTATTTLRDQGVDSIPDVDESGQLHLVEAAREGGVRHFVYVSFPSDLDGDVPSPLAKAKRAVENALRSSAMTFTILQPACFMEVWLGPAIGFDYAGGSAQVFGSGDAPVAYISLVDVARFVVASLDHPAARNVTLPLVAQNVSMNEAVRTFEAVSGRTFAVRRVPIEALEQQLAAARSPLEQSFGTLMLGVARGAAQQMDERQAAFGIECATVEEYARRSVTPIATS